MTPWHPTLLTILFNTNHDGRGHASNRPYFWGIHGILIPHTKSPLGMVYKIGFTTWPHNQQDQSERNVEIFRISTPKIPWSIIIFRNQNGHEMWYPFSNTVGPFLYPMKFNDYASTNNTRIPTTPKKMQFLGALILGIKVVLWPWKGVCPTTEPLNQHPSQMAVRKNPLLNIQKTMENHHLFNGKSTIPLTIFNSYVSLPEGRSHVWRIRIRYQPLNHKKHPMCCQYSDHVFLIRHFYPCFPLNGHGTGTAQLQTHHNLHCWSNPDLFIGLIRCFCFKDRSYPNLPISVRSTRREILLNPVKKKTLNPQKENPI